MSAPKAHPPRPARSGPDNICLRRRRHRRTRLLPAGPSQIVGAAAIDRRAASGARAPAARAAALRRARTIDLDEDEDEEPLARAAGSPPLLTLLLAGLLIGAGRLGWTWTDAVPIIGSGTATSIILDIPQSLGPLGALPPSRVTDVSLDELSESTGSRLEDPVLRSRRRSAPHLEQLRLSAATAKAGASSSRGARNPAQSGAKTPQSGNTTPNQAPGVG